jgi:hypothetical protein
VQKTEAFDISAMTHVFKIVLVAWVIWVDWWYAVDSCYLVFAAKSQTLLRNNWQDHRCLPVEQEGPEKGVGWFPQRPIDLCLCSQSGVEERLEDLMAGMFVLLVVLVVFWHCH